jgi:hypothetical protein
MYCKLICILYALLCWQNFILVKSGCYIWQGFYWPAVINDVARLVETCEACQKFFDWSKDPTQRS